VRSNTDWGTGQVEGPVNRLTLSFDAEQADTYSRHHGVDGACGQLVFEQLHPCRRPSVYTSWQQGGSQGGAQLLLVLLLRRRRRAEHVVAQLQAITTAHGVNNDVLLQRCKTGEAMTSGDSI